MTRQIEIAGRPIGPGHPAYVVAELSANHHQALDEAIALVRAAHAAGADAVKLQTYTPDTITIACRDAAFRIRGTPWDGQTLYDLYGDAYTPWEWHAELQAAAHALGIGFFSTPFDPTAVDFLEGLRVPAYKIASFEIVDLPLIERVARTGKPIIISTGMATLAEIDDAVRAAQGGGASEIVLLRCASSYPASPDDMHLRTIPHLAEAFDLPVGLSDHTHGIATPAAAVALGACMVEKHLTRSRAVPGPDSAFSLEPDEFTAMVDAVRTVERSLGTIRFGPTERERESLIFRRSLFVVADVPAGAPFTTANVRSIRPGHGLPPGRLGDVLGRCAARDIARGTPLDWSLVSSGRTDTATRRGDPS